MANTLKVYLDTSVISALFDKRNPERKRITERFFERLSEFEIYISRFAVREIGKAHSPKLRDKMIRCIKSMHILEESDEIIALGQEYISSGAIPPECSDDAYHIATAVLNDIRLLMSWNFKHIVRGKTRQIVGRVNRLKDLPQIIILTPREI